MIFSKNADKLESFVGVNSTFKGNIETKGTFRIDGMMEGNIEADWVILGEASSVNGDIVGRGVIVGGMIRGNVTAKEIVEIKSKGRVTGDITAGKLTINEGGMFEGRSNMHGAGTKEIEYLPQEAQKGDGSISSE